MAAYNTNGLRRIAHGGNVNTVGTRPIGIFSYVTADLATDIETAGYFNTAYQDLAVDDVIWAVVGVGGTPQSKQYIVTASSSVAVTISAGLLGGATNETFNNVTLTGLLNESVATAITAGTTRTQAGATALTKEVNRVDTSTAPAAGAVLGDGVSLPASSGGLTIMITNNTANPIQVYGAGTDTINGVATATGVAQPPNSICLYVSGAAGSWQSEGLGTGFAGALQSVLSVAGVTAFAGGGQASAVALPAQINRVSTVATQGDSVKLPAATVGLAVTVLNRGANPMQVFGAGTDTINAIATATGISQGVGTAATYVCTVAGNWDVPITSLQSTVPTALTTNGAIPSHVGHTYVITKAGVLADTLAAPTSGTDDGIEITITSNTANAHTLTATGLLQTGSASVNVATFAAFAGAGLTLMAFGGKWNVISSVGITFS